MHAICRQKSLARMLRPNSIIHFRASYLMAHHKRQSFLCPNCKKLISTSEKQCPYCGMRNPTAWWKNNILSRGFNDPSLLLKWIIGVNIGIYVICLLLNPKGFGLALNPLTFLSPSG